MVHHLRTPIFMKRNFSTELFVSSNTISINTTTDILILTLFLQPSRTEVHDIGTKFKIYLFVFIDTTTPFSCQSARLSLYRQCVYIHQGKLYICYKVAMIKAPLILTSQWQNCILRRRWNAQRKDIFYYFCNFIFLCYQQHPISLRLSFMLYYNDVKKKNVWQKWHRFKCCEQYMDELSVRMGSTWKKFLKTLAWTKSDKNFG